MPLELEQMALPQIFPDARETYRSSWHDIEDYDKVYLLTWNPKPRFYNYDMHGDNDFEMQWRTMLDKLLQAYRCCSRYAFAAEVSDQGKLHIHGYIVLSDKLKFYKSFLPTLRINGFVKMQKANSHKWKTFKYHVKDLQSTVEFIKDNPIVITHENNEGIRRELALYKALLTHNYDSKQIMKRNVMAMMGLEDIEYD